MSGVTAPLKHDVLLAEVAKSFLASDKTMLFVVGASGTGKTTALMKCCLSLRREPDTHVFYLEDGSRADVSDVVSAMKSVGVGTKILFIDNISLFQEVIPVLERNARQAGIKIVTQVRSGEWNSRVQRYCEFPHIEWKMPDLHTDDYEHLRKGLMQYAIAPEFRSKSKEDQLAELKRAKHQLLALMKAVTAQRGFEALIESEYQGIDNRDARYMYMIVGLAALGKGRFTPGELTGISSYLSGMGSVARAIADLEDLVTKSTDGRLVGRHDIIIRHVIESAANATELADCIVAVLRYFRAFGEPVISRLDRQKGNVFKYVINWSFYIDVFRKRGETAQAERIYETIERDYQQDGLYWLQRGLFYRRLGKSTVALEYLERSVQAYPDGQFARHALAQQRLINATNSKDRSARALSDVNWAVEELNRQDRDLASWVKDPAAEEYPLVTLSKAHLGYLMAVGHKREAEQYAAEYFERLQVLERSISRVNPYVEGAKRACLMLSSTGKWEAKAFTPRTKDRRRRH
jgi:tetratricopeptide (TPR) repeat protein